MINSNMIQGSEEIAPNINVPMLRVDFACGDAKPEGWIGIDIAETSSADILSNLAYDKFPLDDASVDEGRCSHFFEHLAPAQRIHFMNELYRVLKPGAGCTFITPKGFDRQVQDFTHQWPPVVIGSYYYFDKQWLEVNKLSHYRDLYDIRCDFEIRPINISVTPEFALKSEEHRVFAVNHYANASLDLTVVVVKR